MTAIITTVEQLRDLLRQELPAAIENHARKPNPQQLYTRAQVARFLGKSKPTIKLMIEQNRLQTTTDGKYISQQSINNYITGKQQLINI